MKLPESSSSPARFKTGSLSPVMSDSFTSASPSKTMASAQICCPVERCSTSFITIPLTGIVCSFPSRSTEAFGAEMRESLSIVRFALMPWNEPIIILEKITPKNKRFLNEPTSKTNSASTKFKMLKNVNVFSKMICFSVLVLMPSSAFESPSRTRCATCSEESPCLRSKLSIPLRSPFSYLNIRIHDTPPECKDIKRKFLLRFCEFFPFACRISAKNKLTFYGKSQFNFQVYPEIYPNFWHFSR